MANRLLVVDSRNRITLPANTKIDKGDTVEYSMDDEGRVLLTPMVIYPKHQEWAHTPEFDKLLEDAMNNKSPMIDMSKPGVLDALRTELMAKRNTK